MPGLELPSQYQAIHHAGREGGRTERRKIMYNTNKVSPPAFIPNQFLVKEPNPEGLQAGGREGGCAPGRNLVTRCTPVNRYKSCHLHTIPLRSPHSPPQLLAAAQEPACTHRTQVPLVQEQERVLVRTARLGKHREHKGASPAGTVERGQASACRQLDFFPRSSHSHLGRGALKTE